MHCVIVGFSRNTSVKPRLWDYPDVRGEAVLVPVEKSINAYLVDGPNILISKRMQPLNNQLPPATRGSQPTDGGHLIVEAENYPEFVNDTVAAKYLRPYRGSRELIRGLDRWCLWMDDENFDPSDLQQSKLLYERVTGCREFRESSSPSGDAYKLRTIPHLFRPNSKRPTVDYLCIPRVVSENRRFFTAAQFSADTITSDSAFTVEDPTGLSFALISSSMFITWQQTVGGRLKSDLRFSSTLTWNTFPVPELDSTSKERIIAAGQKILEARELHPERSLADHYNPLAMDPALLKAHDALDKEVDKAFGAPRKLTSERQRQELLFENYSKLAS